MVDIQTISIVLTSMSAIVAFTYYSLTLRNTNKTRQAQLFMQLYDTYRDKKFMEEWISIFTWSWEDYDDYWEKYGWDKNPEANASFSSVSALLEGVGVLVRRNLIDPNLVHDLLWIVVRNYWMKFRPIILGMRTQLNDPSIFRWIEYLYNEIRPIEERQLTKLDN